MLAVLPPRHTRFPRVNDPIKDVSTSHPLTKA